MREAKRHSREGDSGPGRLPGSSEMPKKSRLRFRTLSSETSQSFKRNVNDIVDNKDLVVSVRKSYLSKSSLILQIESDIEQRQKRVDELKLEKKEQIVPLMSFSGKRNVECGFY